MFLALGRKVFVFILLLVAGTLNAQKDTIYAVPESEIVAPRSQKFNAGTKSWQADSSLIAQYRPNTLGEILGQQSGMFIRTFTPGTLATPLFRGTYGVHTAVLWNGFNLQSPMNHFIDLNLIPAFFTDDIALNYGSHTALYGSGAIGGALQFGQQKKHPEGLHGAVIASAGSFGLYNQGIRLGYRKGRYTTVVRYFGQRAENNYPYTNTAVLGKPVQKLPHAQTRQTGFMWENYFAIGTNKTASLNVWYQQAHRNVAPKMIQQQSVAYQDDNVWRITGDIKVKKTRWEGVVRAAYFDERIRYIDTISKVDGNNRGQSVIIEGEGRYFISALHSLNFGVNGYFLRSPTVDYGPVPPEQFRSAAFLSHNYRSFNNKLNTTLSLRQEVVSKKNYTSIPLLAFAQHFNNLKLLPFIYTAGADWNFYKTFTASAKISRIYRLPHFNDLYWHPGGNPDLQPEKGYSAETRIHWAKKRRHTEYTAGAGVFYNDINNWIIWLQGIGGIWTPRNIQRVLSRGIEAQATINTTLSKNFYIKADARYTYVRSTNEKKVGATDESYKKQLVYIPHHTAAGNLSFGYKKYYLRINQQYNGQQYITTDNSMTLPAYYTTNIFAGTRFTIKKTTLEINAQALNILGLEYQVVEWTPMPGRNYLLSMQLNF